MVVIAPFCQVKKASVQQNFVQSMVNAAAHVA